MRRATVLAAFVSPAAWLAANLAVHPARAQNFDFTGHPPVRANSPGLECRQTRHPLYALDAPSPAARRVAVISAFVAVSGPAVDGYVPVALPGWRKGWVPAADTVRNTRTRSCFVERVRDGRLLFSPHNLIQ